MASTGILNGTSMTVYVGGVAIAHATSCTLNVNADMRDASTKSSGGWKEILPGQRNWSVDFEGFFAQDAAFGFSDLFATVTNRTSVTIKVSTESTGDNYYTGTAYLSAETLEAPLEDNASFTCTFDGSGALSEATVS